MPNIRPLSDLHFEDKVLDVDGRDNWIVQDFVTAQQNTDLVDVAALAGDIGNVTKESRIEGVLEPFCSIFKHVLYVAGNHEYWHSDARKVMPILKALEKKFPNLKVLDNEIVEIEGKRYIGGTAWFDLSAESQAFLNYKMFGYGVWHDYRVIHGEAFKYIRERGEGFKTLLKKELRAGDIVITHHAPSQRSIQPRYMGAANNMYYVHDMPNWVWERKPALWIHGHMHTRMYYQMNETTVVCNPKGHPHDEPTGFDPNLIVTVP